MSYQLIELKLENYLRQVTETNPLYISMGALSPNDATTLKVSVVVGAVSVGCSAAMSVEQSWDGGLTWTTVTTSSSGAITAIGTHLIWLTADSGMVSPNLRLKILPDAGDALYVTKLYRSYTTGGILVPRDAGVGGGGASTEAKQDVIIGYVDGVEAGIATLITNSEQWPYAAHNAITYSWDGVTFTEVITYKTGGTGGTTVGTITNVFTDATKATPVSTVYSPAVKVGG